MTAYLPLRRVARLVNGGTPTSDEAHWGGDVPWATPIDLARVDGGYISATDRTLTPAGLSQGSATVSEGSLVLSTRAPIGYVALAAQTIAFNQGCKGLVPMPRTDGRFLRYWLSASRDNLQAAGSGSTFMELSGEALMSFPVPTRPPEDQCRIADFLDDQVTRIDNIVAARQQQTAFAQAALGAEVITRLLGGGDTNGRRNAYWYRAVPTDWPVRPVRAAWQVIDCKHRTPTYVDEGYPLVSPGDISPAALDLSRCDRFVDRLDYLDLADDVRRCQLGDVVYSRNASAGTAALVTTDAPFTMGQDVCRITSAAPSQAYLFYALNYLVTPQLESVRVGSTFTRINVDQIKSLRVPIPAYGDQEAIVRSVGSLVSGSAAIVSIQREQVERLQELKRSLITAAVIGEFDVSSADGSRVLA